uniref:Galectin n=1 Tax=Heterorhabditis bacteriophora TaxID=37862 RepID=A0A1I7WJM9_HETBA
MISVRINIILRTPFSCSLYCRKLDKKFIRIGHNSFFLQICLHNFLVFSVDRLDFSGVLPKFNNFIDRRPLNFPPVTIHIAGGKQVFYSILSNPRCIRCESPVVIVLADTALPIKVEFELNENNGWMYPECVKLHVGSNIYGSLNFKLTRYCPSNMVHTSLKPHWFKFHTRSLRIQRRRVVYHLRLSNSDAVASPVMAGISLLLCALSFVCTIFRKGIKTQLIRLGFIFFFVLNATNIYLIDKISISEVFCPVRNAVFSFTTSSPFVSCLNFCLLGIVKN